MENSHIQWTDHTFNPWIGCTKVSPGCLYCYAEARDQRFAKGIHWGKGARRQRTSESNWREPLKWNREALSFPFWCVGCDLRYQDAEALGTPHTCPACQKTLTQRRARVFCASLADWLDEEVPIDWLVDLLSLIQDTPKLNWQLLTKRPENWKDRLRKVYNAGPSYEITTFHEWIDDWLTGKKSPSNVWLGTSIEDQARADERIPALLDIPAKVRFLSCEPLLGPVDINFSERWCDRTAIDHECDTLSDHLHWVICGGESGHGAREMQLTWAAGLRNQCQRAGVAFFMKQLGSNCMMNLVEAEGEHFHHFTGPGKGGELDQIPVGLRIREFPKAEVPV